MEYLLTIQGRLCDFNKYITAERTNRYKGATLKRDNEIIVSSAIRKCLGGVKIRKPVTMHYTWYEKNKRRDKDNISSFGRKVIQDALVKRGVLENDGWKQIREFSDKFEVDADNPRIVVLIREVEDER